MTENMIIQTKQLTKSFRSYNKAAGFMGTLKSFVNRSYQTKVALQNFDCSIKAGELVGLLGPNGAGKTTLMKMLTGIIVPSTGTATVLGFEPSKRAVDFCKNIALVLGNKSQLWWDLPAYDSFKLLQKYYEVTDQKFAERVELLASSLNVGKFLYRNIRTLSLGERMKMELMACLLHDPQVLFLDEPTIGLDVDAQISIRNFLLEYHRQHKCTIIITSHYMADIEALCQRIIFVMAGQKRFDGQLAEFAKILGDQKSIRFIFASSVDQTLDFWRPYNPEFNTAGTLVDLLLPLDKIGVLTSEILSKFPVLDFQAEKLPIERVVAKIIRDPKLLTMSSNNAE